MGNQYPATCPKLPSPIFLRISNWLSSIAGQLMLAKAAKLHFDSTRFWMQNPGLQRLIYNSEATEHLFSVLLTF